MCRITRRAFDPTPARRQLYRRYPTSEIAVAGARAEMLAPTAESPFPRLPWAPRVIREVVVCPTGRDSQAVSPADGATGGS